MLQGDVRDHAKLRGDHVGGIQAAAHAGLDHGPVDLAAGELIQGHGGGELEEGGFAPPGTGPLNPPEELDDLRVGNLFTVDLNAFVETHQVRGGVEPHPVAGFHEDGGQGRCDRSLAVGAGDVDAAVAPVGVAQAGEHPADGGQPPA